MHISTAGMHLLRARMRILRVRMHISTAGMHLLRARMRILRARMHVPTARMHILRTPMRILGAERTLGGMHSLSCNARFEGRAAESDGKLTIFLHN